MNSCSTGRELGQRTETSGGSLALPSPLPIPLPIPSPGAALPGTARWVGRGCQAGLEGSQGPLAVTLHPQRVLGRGG